LEATSESQRSDHDRGLENGTTDDSTASHLRFDSSSATAIVQLFPTISPTISLPVADRTLAWSHAVDDAVAAVDAGAGEWPVCRSPRRRNSVCGTSETSEHQIKYPFRNCHLRARVARARAREGTPSGSRSLRIDDEGKKEKRKREVCRSHGAISVRDHRTANFF